MRTGSFFVVVNPRAGRGHALRVWKQVEPVFQEAGVSFFAQQTAGPGHATALAAQAVREGWEAVVAVGGDGTVNEVANGLLQAREETGEEATRPLGILPSGSGNDFVKLLGLYGPSPRDVACRLLRGQTRLVDAGQANGRYFVNGVGWGFDGHVAFEAQKVHWLRGMAVYVWALLKSLRRYQNAPMRIEVDGQVYEMVVTLAAVANGACYGGGFWICPHARLDDGWLDVCVGEAMTPSRILQIVPRVMRGTHVGQPDIHFFKGRVVDLYSKIPLPAQADGELLGEALTHLHVKILHKALCVLV